MSGAPQRREWNPRYVAYARAHGRTPEEQFEADREAEIGMAGFIHWIAERKHAFQRIHPEAFLRDAKTARATFEIMDFEAWDRFLGVE